MIVSLPQRTPSSKRHIVGLSTTEQMKFASGMSRKQCHRKEYSLSRLAKFSGYGNDEYGIWTLWSELVLKTKGYYRRLTFNKIALKPWKPINVRPRFWCKLGGYAKWHIWIPSGGEIVYLHMGMHVYFNATALNSIRMCLSLHVLAFCCWNF